MSTTGGYGRLVVRLDVEIDAEVRVSSGVLIVQFKQPVDISVDRITAGASQYFGAARRDPDGRAVRFALQQKLKVSTMTAGERLFVDLLPESWTGEPPGLPREIVEDLARRAKEAERQTQARLALEAQRRIPMVRVRVANQATFTRYIFELPELTPVSSERAKDKLTLTFAGHLRFDLSDAKLSLPKIIEAIDAENDGSKSNVKFSFAQPADVRAFREDANYVVDVTPVTARTGPPIALPAAVLPQTGPLADATPPDTVRAKDAAGQGDKAEAKSEPKPDAGPEAEAPGLQPKVAEAPASSPRFKRRVSRLPSRPVAVELRRHGDGLRLFFPFAEKTPVAVISTRRHALACVRHRGADRRRAPEQRSEPDHPQRGRFSRGRRAGCPLAARTAASRQRRRGGGRLVGFDRRRHAERGQAADHRAQHRDGGPHQPLHSIRAAAQGALACRSGHRRQASGRHRSWSVARAGPNPGFRRLARDRERPRHRGPALRRRHPGRIVGRQGAAGASRRADAVGGRSAEDAARRAAP